MPRGIKDTRAAKKEHPGNRSDNADATRKEPRGARRGKTGGRKKPANS